MIPHVGPVIFAGITTATFIWHQSNRTRTHQVTATKIEMLERNLFQHMKDRGLNRISSTLASLNRAVGFCNEKQVFEKIHADDRLLVEERYADFRKHAFSTTDNSLEVMLEELTGEFRWGDDDIQQAIITLVPFMVQCMELKLILNANLATIYRARGDNLTAADHDAAFYNGIDEVIYRLRDIGKSLNVWMKKQQEERLALFSANVEQLDQNDPKFPIVPDRRTWKITDHGSKRVFAVYGSRYDISMNTNEADVSDKMKGYMGEMASWYADRLKEHTDKHFVMLRDSVEKWNQVADHLNTHWKDGGQEEAPDGVRMYYQMRGLLKADDPKPAKAT